jgi:MSHA biogenesis protein MshJ
MNPWQTRAEQAIAKLLRLRRAFDARARRERLLLIGAAMAVGLMAADQLWLTPALNAWQGATRRQTVAAEALQTLNNTIAQRGMESRALDQQLQRDLSLWRSKVQQGEAELRAFGSSLVPAAEMLPVLEHMLAQSGGLRLRSMQSIARTELAAAGAAVPPAAASSANTLTTPEAAPPALYRHGVELTVEGSYADLLAYLQALEAMPQRLLWGGVQMKVDHYPKALLTLRLYTLSMDRGWLEI